MTIWVKSTKLLSVSAINENCPLKVNTFQQSKSIMIIILQNITVIMTCKKDSWLFANSFTSSTFTLKVLLLSCVHMVSSSRNNNLYHWSLQPAVTFNMAKLLQFPTHDTVYEFFLWCSNLVVSQYFFFISWSTLEFFCSIEV